MTKTYLIFLIGFILVLPLNAAQKKQENVKLEKALNKTLMDLRIDPKKPDNYFIAADIYKRLSRPLEAASIYKRLLNNKQIKDKNSLFKANFYLASLYLFDRKFDQSIHYYKNAVDIEPFSTSARINLGTAYLNSQSYYAAIDQYTQVITNNPNYAIVYFNIARSYEKLKKHNLAKQNYRTFLNIIKQDGTAKYSDYDKYIKIAQAKLSRKDKKNKIVR